MSEKVQLWVCYELQGGWKMEGFFDSDEEANAHYAKLWDDENTPCISNSYNVRVKVS